MDSHGRTGYKKRIYTSRCCTVGARMSSEDHVDPLESLIAQILDAEQRGDPVDRDALLAEHSEHAESLRDFFADHDRMKSVVAGDLPNLPSGELIENRTPPPQASPGDPTVEMTGDDSTDCTSGTTRKFWRTACDASPLRTAMGRQMRCSRSHGGGSPTSPTAPRHGRGSTPLPGGLCTDTGGVRPGIGASSGGQRG